MLVHCRARPKEKPRTTYLRPMTRLVVGGCGRTTEFAETSLSPGPPTRIPDQLDSAEQIAILLEVAGELDRGEAVIDLMDRDGRTWTHRHPILTTGRRAAIATLLLGGGRASATGATFWRDVDLANGRFVVGRDKTHAGMREVDMLPLLREILTEHKAATEHAGPNDPVFVTSIGKAALAAQHSPRRRRRRGRARDQARRSARPTTTAARDHPAQAAAYVRLDPRGDRQGPPT